MNTRTSTHTIDLDDTHIVPINPEKEHSKGAGVDNSQTVRFPRDKVESGVLVEPR